MYLLIMYCSKFFEKMSKKNWNYSNVVYFSQCLELWNVQWSPTFPVQILVVDGFESSGQSSGQSSSQSSDQSSGQSSGQSSDQSSGQIYSYIYFLKPQALLIIFFDFFRFFFSIFLTASTKFSRSKKRSFFVCVV